MNARNAFNCIAIDDNDATTLGHRAVTLMTTVEMKVSGLRTQQPSVEEILLGTVSERLRAIPVADFDATAGELAKHVKKHGCCSVTVRNDQYRLSDLIQQMKSTAELLEPFRPMLAKLEGK